MSILAYYAPLNAVVTNAVVRQNRAAPESLGSNSLLGYEEEFARLLEGLRLTDFSAPTEGSIRRLLAKVSPTVKPDTEGNPEERLLVIGPKYLALYLVNGARNGGFTQQTESRTPVHQSGGSIITLTEYDAVTQFFRSALGWMPDGERDRGHVEAFRQAHAYALEHKLAGIALNRLFQRALWLYEKVRLETDFFQNPITPQEVLAEVAGKIFGGLKERAALLVGNDETIPNFVEALRQAGIGRLLHLAPNFNQSAGTGTPEILPPNFFDLISEGKAELPFIDLLLLFDGGDKRLREKVFLQKLMASRNNAPLIFADLATSYVSNEAATNESINKMYNLFWFRRRDLQQMVEQNRRIREQIEAEVSGWIQQEVKQFYQWLNSEDHVHFGMMVGRSRPMQRVFELIARIAQTDITVLIEGESGTGKELVARAIHQSSHRARRPFVVVNCGAIPENLLESELFGHVRGAFTGAVSNKRGLFEEAHGGTIFLDEIAEMSPALQVKLLRFLQEGEIKRVGSNNVMKLDVRVLTATNRNLQRMVEEGKFRSDLYYRLNVIQITLPPLRERREDLSSLVIHFMRKYASRLRKPVGEMAPEVMECLRQYHWPGNVRELENVMERAVALSVDAKIGIAELPTNIRESSPQLRPAGRLTLKEVEQQHILDTIAACQGNYEEAAHVLGIGRTTLWRKLKTYQEENDKTRAAG